MWPAPQIQRCQSPLPRRLRERLSLAPNEDRIATFGGYGIRCADTAAHRFGQNTIQTLQCEKTVHGQTTDGGDMTVTQLRSVLREFRCGGDIVKAYGRMRLRSLSASEHRPNLNTPTSGPGSRPCGHPPVPALRLRDLHACPERRCSDCSARERTSRERNLHGVQLGLAGRSSAFCA